MRHFCLTLWLAIAAGGHCVYAGPPGTKSVSIPAQAQAYPSAPTHIVTCRRGVDVDALAHEFGVSPRFIYHHAINGFAAALDSQTVLKLQTDGRVLAVEEDGPIMPAGDIVPLGVIRMALTNFPPWNGAPINVDVAVMDTGIQTNHPDLNVVEWLGFADSSMSGDDWNGHGTMVAGVIGAVGIDGGVVGVAPGARLHSIQVIGQVQHSWSTFLAGLDFVIYSDPDIEVINASLTSAPGTTSPVYAISASIRVAVEQGIVFVAAAGNSGIDIAGPDGIFGTPDDVCPAAVPDAMAVSAMDPSDDLFVTSADNTNFASNFSSFPHTNRPAGTFGSTDFGDFSVGVVSPGAAIDVAAPGVGIATSYLGSSYVSTFWGTSAAAPHAAGLVALYISQNGRAHSSNDVYNIRQAIINNSQPQAAWASYPNTDDPDSNPEPLAYPSLNWVPAPPLITGVAMTTNGFQLSFPTLTGFLYTAQSADELAPITQWTNLTTVTGTGGSTAMTITDPSPAATRFYRLFRQPPP